MKIKFKLILKNINSTQINVVMKQLLFHKIPTMLIISNIEAIFKHNINSKLVQDVPLNLLKMFDMLMYIDSII
jgi:hypothetical protein